MRHSQRFTIWVDGGTVEREFSILAEVDVNEDEISLVRIEEASETQFQLRKQPSVGIALELLPPGVTAKLEDRLQDDWQEVLEAAEKAAAEDALYWNA